MLGSAKEATARHRSARIWIRLHPNDMDRLRHYAAEFDVSVAMLGAAIIKDRLEKADAQGVMRLRAHLEARA